MAKGTLALRRIQLGDNADTSKNFVISVPAVADGTLTIERENGTDVLSIDANGKVAFPQGFSYPIIGGLSSSGGTLGSGSWTGTVTKIGALEIVTGVVNIVSVNTATGSLIILGANPNSKSGYGTGRSGVTGKALQVRPIGTGLGVSNYDDTSPIAVGQLSFTTVLGA